MENKITSVRYIENQLIINSILYRLSFNDQMEIRRIFNAANKIHKEEIKKANIVGMSIGYNDNVEDLSEKYYKETYGK